MKKIVLNIYLWLSFIIVTLASLIVFPLFLLICAVFGRRTVDSAIRLGIVFYGWILVKVVPFFAPVRVDTRTGKLPSPAIIVANHNSAIDPYLFGALLVDASFITSWPFKIPIYGFFMRLAKYVDATEGWEKVNQNSTRVLRSGASLIVWPEGHRSRNGRLGRFKNGAFSLAVKTGYPLLPICIVGTENFLPPGRMSFSPSRIKLILLDPIYPDLNNDPEQEIIKLRNTAWELINNTIQEEHNPTEKSLAFKGVEEANQC